MVQLVLVVTDDDQGVEPRILETGAEPAERRLRRFVPRRHPLGGDLAGDRRRGARELRLVGGRVAVGIEQVAAPPVALDEARPILGRRVEHRRMRGGSTENQPGHRASSLSD